jgi:hypothetical protein
VFDDPRTGLKEEAFVSGADTMIDTVIAAKRIPEAADGFSLSFSNLPFSGYDVELEWLRAGSRNVLHLHGEVLYARSTR